MKNPQNSTKPKSTPENPLAQFPQNRYAPKSPKTSQGRAPGRFPVVPALSPLRHTPRPISQKLRNRNPAKPPRASADFAGARKEKKNKQRKTGNAARSPKTRATFDAPCINKPEKTDLSLLFSKVPKVLFFSHLLFPPSRRFRAMHNPPSGSVCHSREKGRERARFEKSAAAIRKKKNDRFAIETTRGALGRANAARAVFGTALRERCCCLSPLTSLGRPPPSPRRR